MKAEAMVKGQRSLGIGHGGLGKQGVWEVWEDGEDGGANKESVVRFSRLFSLSPTLPSLSHLPCPSEVLIGGSLRSDFSPCPPAPYPQPPYGRDIKRRSP